MDFLRWLAVLTHYFVGRKFFVGGFVLEVGCGSAKASRLLTGGRGVLVGLDLSLSALKKAKEKCLYGYYVLADLNHIPLREDTFDLVWSMGVLEHLSNLSLGISEMIRVAKEKSYILAIIPTSNNLLCKIRDIVYRFTGFYYDFENHWGGAPSYQVSAGEILLHFNKNGLEDNKAKMIFEEALIETLIVAKKPEVSNPTRANICFHR